jgi:hypothetical protein
MWQTATITASVKGIWQYIFFQFIKDATYAGYLKIPY